MSDVTFFYDHKPGCSGCVSWKRLEDRIEGLVLDWRKSGECRRHAPTSKDYFPITLETEWCGDFKPPQSYVTVSEETARKLFDKHGREAVEGMALSDLMKAIREI